MTSAKRIVRGVLFGLVLSLTLGAGLGCKKKEDVVSFENDDAEMNAAVAEARQKVPEFVTAFESRKDGEEFSAKYPFKTSRGHEHIWLEVTAINAEQLTGTIANDPVHDIGHKLGDPVTVPTRELSDWVITRKGSKDMVGGFTIKVMLKREKHR